MLLRGSRIISGSFVCGLVPINLWNLSGGLFRWEAVTARAEQFAADIERLKTG
jgi:hypothetical protein